MPTKTHPRSKLERAQAAERLAHDGELVPVYLLMEIAGAGKQALARWITEGKCRGGVRIYLDGLRDPLMGFCSSREALARFLAQFPKAEEG